MRAIARLSKLIGQIYDAALEPARWPRVVENVVDALHSRGGLLFTPLHTVDQSGFAFPVNIEQSVMQQYASRYQAQDVWVQASAQRELIVSGNVFTGDELVPRKQLLATTFYREFLRPSNTSRVCFSIVFGAEAAGVPSTVLSIHRGFPSRAFSEAAKDLMRLLNPHLSRSLGIMLRLRDADLKVAATLAALDRLAGGVVLIGEQRAVVFANRAAKLALNAEDGLRLGHAPHGKEHFAAESPDVQREIDRALDVCLDPNAIDVPHFMKTVRVDRPSGRPAYALNVSMLPPNNEFGAGPERPLAIAFLSDPAEPVRVDEEVLRRLYGLTAAECRLAGEVCSGDPLAAIATRLGLTENTVKTQLRNLFEKTGSHRQSQLVKLLLSLSTPR